MLLNLKHHKLNRLDDGELELLKKLLNENEGGVKALLKLLDSYVTEEKIDPDAVNWAIKRASLDGRLSLIKNIKDLFKE